MYKFFRRFFETPEVRKRAKIAEDIIFGRGSTQADVQIAEATARLTEALCSNGAPGVVDAGTFLFVKSRMSDGTFRIAAKRLSVEDRIILNERPVLSLDPAEALTVFSPIQNPKFPRE